jgi:hypothetical protein
MDKKIVNCKQRWFLAIVFSAFFLSFVVQSVTASAIKANTNPTGCTSNPVLISNQWQNISNQPTFTWSGATGTIEGYYIYFGTNSSGTDITAFTTETTYQPALGINTATYYLRINTKDTGEDIPDLDWVTLFILKFDNSPPTFSASESGGALNGDWQNFVASPSFSISLPDAGAGLDGYYLYWGLDPVGTSSEPIIQGIYTFTPGAVTDGEYFLRLNAVDLLGNTSGWQTTFIFRLDTLNPPPVSGVIETNGLLTSAWGNISNPSFTWDAPLGATKYNIMWGSDPLSTIPTNVNITQPFSPNAVLGIDNYLRIQSLDSAGNLSAWSNVLFYYWYDNTPPTAVTSVSETANGIISGHCTILKNATFTWGPSTATGAPIAGYYYYWGIDPLGDAPHSSISGPPFTLSLPKGDKYYLRMAAYDDAGNISTWNANFILCNGDAVRLVSAVTGGEINLGVPDSVVNASITFSTNAFQVFEDPVWVGKDFWARLWYPTMNGHRDPTAGKVSPFNHQSFNLAADQASDSSNLFSLTLPFTISLIYSEESILAMYENSLAIYRWDGDRWKILSNSTLDTVNNIVTGTTTYLGEYILMGDPIPSMEQLSIIAAGISFGVLPLSGRTSIRDGVTNPWIILDATYSDQGWYVTIRGTDFIDAQNHTISIENLSIQIPQENIQLLVGSSAPVSLVTEVTSMSESNINVLASQVGSSTGRFSVTPLFKLNIPAETYGGIYSSQLFITIIRGPVN